MGKYLKRVQVDSGVHGVDSWYYADNGKVSISETDDVVIDLEKPFVCPDCSGTFLYKLTDMEYKWFHDKYVCKDCHALFVERIASQ